MLWDIMDYLNNDQKTKKLGILRDMYKPFKRLLLSYQEKSMKEQHKLLEEKFIDWKGNYNQIDDVCILGLKI